MSDKTKQQLTAENEDLRRRVKELEAFRNGAGNGSGRSEPDDDGNGPVVVLLPPCDPGNLGPFCKCGNVSGWCR
jgi:hypothetical protein